MKPYLLPAVVAAIVFPVYAFLGDAAYTLDVGLLIGALAALYYFDLISLNVAVPGLVVLYVLYLFIGKDTFYLFGLLIGLFFCVVGLYTLSRLFQPIKGRARALLLMAMVAPVTLLLGAYLVWTGGMELGLWTQLEHVWHL